MEVSWKSISREILLLLTWNRSHSNTLSIHHQDYSMFHLLFYQKPWFQDYHLNPTRGLVRTSKNRDDWMNTKGKNYHNLSFFYRSCSREGPPHLFFPLFHTSMDSDSLGNVKQPTHPRGVHELPQSSYRDHPHEMRMRRKLTREQFLVGSWRSSSWPKSCAN